MVSYVNKVERKITAKLDIAAYKQEAYALAGARMSQAVMQAYTCSLEVMQPFLQQANHGDGLTIKELLPMTMLVWHNVLSKKVK